ncbi:Uncharacterised protein [Mycobacteroides abscessus]|nr:Uncharacterised protein [Mycobacteroides abscessus]
MTKADPEWFYSVAGKLSGLFTDEGVEVVGASLPG